MRIIIDMQGAQGANRDKGIGRYSVALARGLVRQRGSHEIILVLNGMLADSIAPLRAIFNDILPPENIVVWGAAAPVSASNAENDLRREAAEVVRESFIASLRPDLVLLTSLFEGQADNGVTSIGACRNGLLTAVVLYDLDPLINPHLYYRSPLAERFYLSKIGHLRRADFVLSTSASTGDEAIAHIGFSKNQVVNISLARDERFQQCVLEERQRAYLCETFGLDRPFVMYVEGMGPGKNAEGLIKAYANLPKSVRSQYQLAIIGAVQPAKRSQLAQLRNDHGLSLDELVITDFVCDEDLILLLNGCRLFVFPDWHTSLCPGVLEAMACGRAVIASNTSRLSEVVDREDALFDPFDAAAISDKMLQVLNDEAFRSDLESYGLKQAQKFSWDITLCRAWQSIEDHVGSNCQGLNASFSIKAKERPRLAYVSPLPPERSGIADYSAELLPELARFYEIDVIVAQEQVSDPSVHAICPIRDVAWFRKHRARYERVLYHFGNSPFHSHMFELQREIPGVIVLHDFFLSNIIAQLDVQGDTSHAWARALCLGHGWNAVRERFKSSHKGDVVRAYPCNLSVLQRSIGVIVHSQFSCLMAQNWYGPQAADEWAVVPFLSRPVPAVNRPSARRALGVKHNAFIVCCFGLLGPTKLNDRLLDAWLKSPLARDPNCFLVFVGQNSSGEYGEQLMRSIRSTNTANRIEITGWVQPAQYHQWLAAADLAVQLRTFSRGETSAAVFDCMKYGLATIVNANGSMAELPEESVWKLPDAFRDEELSDALSSLQSDDLRRLQFGSTARQTILAAHQPRHCAERYAEAIERFYARADSHPFFTAKTMHEKIPDLPQEDFSRIKLALAANHPPEPRCRRLFVDISTLVSTDNKTGIERVVRSVLLRLIQSCPDGYVVEAVYATKERKGYQSARRFTSKFLGIPANWAEDEPVTPHAGDIFLGLDWHPSMVSFQFNVLQNWHRKGVRIWFVVYDILPILLPNCFVEGLPEAHRKWIERISQFDGLLCISRSVADELRDWLDVFGPERHGQLAIDWFHLGADIRNSAPTRGIQNDSKKMLARIAGKLSFLMVGTLENRKCHAQMLSAFEELWRNGHDLNLVFVGKKGWLVDEFLQRLTAHEELGKRLFWFEAISDEYLEEIYAASSCLIAASKSEGFGLPIIEAAQHKLPIIARDIPVFREVAGKNAYYFTGETPEEISPAILDWVRLYRKKQHPESTDLNWLTWRESTAQLLKKILGREHYIAWTPKRSRVVRFLGNDHRMGTQIGERNGQSIRSMGKAGLLIFGPSIHLDAGDYRIVVRGCSERWTGHEKLDVCHQTGRTRIATNPLDNCKAGAWTVDLTILLPMDIDDLEIRIWVDAGADVSVNEILIAPSDAAGEIPELAPRTIACVAHDDCA